MGQTSTCFILCSSPHSHVVCSSSLNPHFYKAVKTAKRRVAEAALDGVYVGNEALGNVLHLEYFGNQLQGGRGGCPSPHGMDIAQSAFGSLSHPWSDHRLSRATKLSLSRISVCSTLTHSCETCSLDSQERWFVI